MRGDKWLIKVFRVFVGAFILGFVILMVSCSNIRHFSVDARVQDYVSKGMYEECLSYLDGLIKTAPKDYYYYSEKGYVLIKEDKSEEAIEILKKADALKPGDDVVLNNLSWANNNLGNYKEALDYSIKSLKIDPNDTTTLANKGNALRGLDRFKEAVSVYNTALKYDPADTICLYGKGLTEFDLKNYNASIQTINKYNKLKPSNTNAYLVLGEAYYYVDEDENAQKSLDKALDLGSSDTDVYYYKGLCFNDKDNYTMAIKMFDTIIKTEPKNADAYYQKGKSLYYFSKYTESLAEFDKAIKLDPKDSYSYTWKAKNYLKLKDSKAALTFVDKALVIDPKDPFIINVQAKTYYAMGKSSKALSILDSAMKLNPDYVDLAIGKASILYNDSLYGDCINFIEEMFNKDKFNDDFDLRWFLAECYSGLDKHNIAIPIYEKLAKDFGTEDAILSDLGWEYYYIQDNVKAEKFGNKALSINPKNADATELIKKLKYSALGDNIKIPDFVKNNYLYLKSSKGFNKASKVLNSKKNASINDIATFLGAIMNKDDRFTYFIEGEYYDDFNKTEKASHITTTSLNLELKLIRIPAFTADTSDEVKKYLLTLKSTESQSLVLDLRDNPGGLILDANEILDLLLPKCISSYLIYSDAYKYEYTSDSKMLKFKKIIVMVNENSASSSELLALSLKKHLNNVTIIGHKTFGKGVGQETYENKAKHFIILLTSFKWYVEGLNVTQTKVVPDVTLKGSSDKVYFGEVNSLVK